MRGWVSLLGGLILVSLGCAWVLGRDLGEVRTLRKELDHARARHALRAAIEERLAKDLARARQAATEQQAKGRR
jgi:hypothetical protein